MLIAITQSNFGGAQRYVFDLARCLSQAMFDVCVTCGAPKGDRSSLIDKLHAEGIRVAPMHHLAREMWLRSDIKAFLDFYRLLRQERPDIVHLNSSKAGGIGALAARIAGVPRIVFTAHGWEFNAPRPRWQRLTIHALSVFIVFLAHRTIAVSCAARDAIRSSLAQRKITVVHNGVAARAIRGRVDVRRQIAGRARITADDFAPWVVTVAELHPVKGLSYGIAAISRVVSRHPDLHYFIVGEGTERESLERLIAEHGLRHRVHLLGFIEDAPSMLSAFDVFLLPSLSEGLPYVLMEAGIAGLPVVASGIGGVPEIVEHGVSGILVDAKDIEALAQGVSRLLGNPAERIRLGSALQSRIRSRFSVEKMVKKTVEAYTSPG